MGDKTTAFIQSPLRRSDLADCLQEIRQLEPHPPPPALVQVGSVRHQFFRQPRRYARRTTTPRPWGFILLFPRTSFLACMKRFGQGEYNGVRHLSPHVMMQLDNGFVMPNGVLHSPTDLCTHEVHVTMDEHFP